MDISNHLYPWLDLLDRPAFCVKSGVIVDTNSAAVHRMLQPGMRIQEIVTQHQNEYEAFQNGCLYLPITVAGVLCNASVTRTHEYDVFVINQEHDDSHLQTLALAAQQLRIPLTNIMTVIDQLLITLDETDSIAQEQANQINHGLFQLLRIICNMSDANRYQNTAFFNMDTVDFNALIYEIMEKAQTTASNKSITLHYSGLETPLYGFADSEQLERAIYNLLSNAIKFAQSGSIIYVKLTRNETALSFSVCNTEDEPSENLSFWNRYRREPSIEDSRCGLGLGMTLISSVAIAHGGTILVDHPLPNQTRVTMSVSIANNNNTTCRSPILRIGDYAGGRDKGLLEFSDILPPESYYKIN